MTRQTPEMKVMTCLLRGVAIWRFGKALKIMPMTDSLSRQGMAWIKANEEDLLQALKPANERYLDKKIRAGLGPAWGEEYRKAKTELEECHGQEKTMKAWALVLGEGHPFDWT